jgi:hypothetical protein
VSDDVTAAPETARVPIAWDGEGTGAVVALDGEVIRVRSSRAFAPGSRPSGRTPRGEEVRMKTHRCKREDTGDGLTFTLEGRTLDMSRDLRAKLVATLTPRPGED